MRLWILVLSAAGFASASCPAPDCDASAPPDAPPYYMLSDPQDCHKFYYCYDEDGDDSYLISDSSFWCQDHGAVFSQKDQLCGDFPCVEACSGTCAPYECIAADPPQDKRGDPYDCSKYHTCADGKTVQCEGDKPFFDGDQCQGDESKCCHCKPYCHLGELFKNVPDPLDCRSFYFCVQEHDFPTYQSTCDTGNFDPFTGLCSETVPCLTLCPAP